MSLLHPRAWERVTVVTVSRIRQLQECESWTRLYPSHIKPPICSPEHQNDGGICTSPKQSLEDHLYPCFNPPWPWRYRGWVTCIQPQSMLSKEEVRVVLLRAGRERSQGSGEMKSDSHGDEFVTCIAVGGISCHWCHKAMGSIVSFTGRGKVLNEAEKERYKSGTWS